MYIVIFLEQIWQPAIRPQSVAALNNVMLVFQRHQVSDLEQIYW